MILEDEIYVPLQNVNTTESSVRSNNLEIHINIDQLKTGTDI